MTNIALETPTISIRKAAATVKELPMAAHVRTYTRMMEMVDNDESQRAKALGGHVLGLAGYYFLTKSGLPSPFEKTRR